MTRGMSGLVEVQFESGSRSRVLRNLLGIKRNREMDHVEAREQIRALNTVIAIYHECHRFTAADVRRIDTMWLGRVSTPGRAGTGGKASRFLLAAAGRT